MIMVAAVFTVLHITHEVVERTAQHQILPPPERLQWHLLDPVP